jgi:hypothetical protein
MYSSTIHPIETSSRNSVYRGVVAISHYLLLQKDNLAAIQKWGNSMRKFYAAIGGTVVVVSLALLLAVWRKHIVSSLSQMFGAFILISAATNLFDSKRKITSSSVNELSLIILRRSNLGVCSSSIFLGRVNSMSVDLMLPLKSLLLWCSGSSLYRTV